MMPISLRTIALSAADGVGMNLATNVLPVAFSTALCTTPKAPLERKKKATIISVKYQNQPCSYFNLLWDMPLTFLIPQRCHSNHIHCQS